MSGENSEQKKEPVKIIVTLKLNTARFPVVEITRSDSDKVVTIMGENSVHEEIVEG